MFSDRRMYDMRHGILPPVIIMFGLSEVLAVSIPCRHAPSILKICYWDCVSISPSELVLRVIIFVILKDNKKTHMVNSF